MIPEQSDRLAALLGQAVLEAVDRAVARRLPELLARQSGATAPEGFISTAEAARRWGVATDTVLAAIAAGRLPASRPGGSKSWRIRPADLEAFIAGQSTPTESVSNLAEKRAQSARRLADAVRGGDK